MITETTILYKNIKPMCEFDEGMSPMYCQKIYNKVLKKRLSGQ